MGASTDAFICCWFPNQSIPLGGSFLGCWEIETGLLYSQNSYLCRLSSSSAKKIAENPQPGCDFRSFYFNLFLGTQKTWAPISINTSSLRNLFRPAPFELRIKKKIKKRIKKACGDVALYHCKIFSGYASRSRVQRILAQDSSNIPSGHVIF